MTRDVVYPINAAQTPTLYAISMTSADTEYSQLLPPGTMKLEFRCRGAYGIRYAFITGKVAGSTDPFKTLKSGEVKSESDLNLTGVMLYVACSTVSQKLELEVWT